MRKLTIAAVLLMSFALFTASCGESKKEKSNDAEKTEVNVEAENTEADAHDHSEDMATAVYQCPMECEDEKTYPEPGTCPECKMKLKKVESSEE